MASVTATMKRFRSRTPVTVLTPLGVLWVTGFVVSMSTDLYRTRAGFGTFIPILFVDLIGAAVVMSFLDRLLRMRSEGASWGMFASFAIFALLTGLAPINLLFGDSNRDYPAAAACIVIALLMAVLGVRELRWLLRSRHGRASVSVV
ncbi:MAG: hypothetical protein NVSMB48_23700 [Marmoricola sp.]